MSKKTAAIVGGVGGVVFMAGLIAVAPFDLSPVAVVEADDDDASAPPPGPCDFPPQSPEPDADCINAISDLQQHGDAGVWTYHDETFSLFVDGLMCRLTIGESTFTVTPFWSASPDTCGVSGSGHTLDIAGVVGNWRVGFDAELGEEGMWSGTVNIDDTGGHVHEGSATP